MKTELLELLRCPKTGQRLNLEDGNTDALEIKAGWLVSADGQHRYPIRNGIPRFVPESNYADNFGMQWNHFSKTQLDSHSGHPITEGRFWKATGWRAEDMKGQWVLDVGCGAGRFAEVALKAGAKLVALDYSSAVDACYANLKHHPNLHVVQGDIYALPFAPETFPFVYSLGVLQHTPDVAAAFSALPPMVRKGGRLCVDYYWKRFRTMLHAKYLLRPITKRMQQPKLFALLERWVPGLLIASQTLGRVPLLGRVLSRLVPAYDSPQTAATVRAWMEEAGMLDVAEALRQAPSVVLAPRVMRLLANAMLNRAGHRLLWQLKSLFTGCRLPCAQR